MALFSVASVAAALVKSLVDSFKDDGSKIKAIATTEGKRLAAATASIAKLLAQGQIDIDEAAVMMSIQKDATEATLSLIEGIGRVAASRALKKALKGVVQLVDGAIGVPLIKAVTDGI